jgi:GNAT superfamily N-acetyltransferase
VISVRRAVPADARDVSRMQVRSWRRAYRGLLAQDYLDALEPDAWVDRYTFGRMGFGQPFTQVAVDGPTVCGMVTTGLCRDDDLSNFGELIAIYVDPPYQRAGVGRLLMTAARTRLRRVGVTTAALWVLDGNAHARRFYERDGWRCDGTHRISTYGDAPADEVRYRCTL